MKNISPPLDEESRSLLSRSLGHRISRFVIATLAAFVMTFVLLFFMRYLIVGYDKTASDAITRYFTLKTIITSNPSKSEVRIERPAKLLERPDFNAPDFSEDTDSQSSFETTAITVPVESEKLLEENLVLPELEIDSAGSKEKLRKIKEAILSQDDQEAE
jgi:hypothetical protein